MATKRREKPQKKGRAKPEAVVTERWVRYEELTCGLCYHVGATGLLDRQNRYSR